jgi:hypothetical protein
VLFRVISALKPTILVDEAETFLGTNEELRGIMNSSHFRPLARVWRCDGDKLEPKEFSTWAPIAVALIGELPGTLQDRSVIIIRMRRRLPGETAQRLRLDRLDDLTQLHSSISRWARRMSNTCATRILQCRISATTARPTTGVR